MIKASYDSQNNAVIIEFSGRIDAIQAERAIPEIQKIVPAAGKGFRVLTDLSKVKAIDLAIKPSVKKMMEFFNQRGAAEVIRVISDPMQDVGFNIMSPFHYSREVAIVTVASREEAETRLKSR